MMNTILIYFISFTLVQVTSFTPSSSVLHLNTVTQSRTIKSTVQSTMDVGNISEPNVDPTTDIIAPVQMATSTSVPETKRREAKKLVDTNLPTWKRRLDTHEDPFNVHKWAGMGWMLSSTAIFGCGAFSGFTEVPEILQPITYLFLLSTLTQSLSSIPMAIKYRANEPSIQRGFISSAISSSSLAFTGFWLGPFGDHLALPNLPDFGMALVALLMLGDSIYNLNAFGDMKEILTKINSLDPIKDAKALPDKVTEFVTTFPVGLPMNVAMLQQLYVHATNARTEFLDILISRGSSSDLVFYASMITSIAICVGNLTATLSHRKLISADVNNFATVSALVATLVFNIRAAGFEIV